MVNLLLVLLLLPGLRCLAADFSADMYLGTKSMLKRGTIYTTGDKLRFVQGTGANLTVSIVRLDKHVAWMLDPKTKTYVEMPLPKGAQSNPRSDEMFRKNATSKRLGVQSVSGYSCDKTSYVSRGNSKQTAVRYYSKKLDWPIKTQMTNPDGQSITQELRNIRVAKQPASLFQIPKGYRKVTPPKGPAPGKNQKR
jgi:outer membrane lipoprotein-sorting protein